MDEFDAEFYRDPVAHIDMVSLHAFIVHAGRKLPINRMFSKVNILRVVDTYTFEDDDGNEHEGRIWGLKDNFKCGYLENVDIRIHRNHFIIRVNCFNEKYNKSVYRILVEILHALYMSELIQIKRVKNMKSLFSRLYYIARDFFTVSEIEFRFDWNRENGIPILEKCRRLTKYQNRNSAWNTVYLTRYGNPNYRIKLYGREKEFYIPGFGAYFPVRLELTLKRRFKPNDLKGTAKRIINRYGIEIQKGLGSVGNKGFAVISDFLNCVYWEDKVKGMNREFLRDGGRNVNQYKLAQF